jgi:alpha-L-rhamnosidase
MKTAAMGNFRSTVYALLLILCAAPGSAEPPSMRLLCDYSQMPINIDSPEPCFSWIVSSSTRDHRQVAYKIEVATTPELLKKSAPDMWSTGMIQSPNTLHIPYGGKRLHSNSTYFWKVTIRDNYNNIIESAPTSFGTALLDPAGWQAKWIGTDPEPQRIPDKGFYMDRSEQLEFSPGDTVVHNGRSLLLRRDYNINKKVKSAVIHISGLGFYELYINGKQVGNMELSPAKTNYAEEILYDTYDVAKMLTNGTNVFGIHLGNGWYNPYKKWWKEYRMQWFGAKKAIMQLHIRFEDGTESVLATDETWKAAPGPVLYNCVYDGELHDARLEQPGWKAGMYSDADWENARVYETPTHILRPQRMPGITIVDDIEPVAQNRIDANTVLYDMGQNFAGWVRIAVRGSRGQRLRLRFAEDIYPDGTLDVRSNERARATAEYILRGNDTEMYEPSFTYFGFRYVEVSSEMGLPQIDDLKGRVVHSDNPPAGSFSCSHALINKIHRATVWSQKSNMLGYPMDCPQRDERLGWMGDAQVSAEQAMYNFDMALFYRNWFTGIRKNQDQASGDIPIISPRPYIKDDGIGWSSTYILMVWNHYVHYGDVRVLREHYGPMVRYLQYLESIADGYILPKGWIGDWGSLVEGWKEGEPESVPTAFFYYNAKTLARVAGVIGAENDHLRFLALADKIRGAYNARYFDPQKSVYNDGSQMALAFPLYLGMVPEQHLQDVLSNLVGDIVVQHEDHLTTGVLGTKYMLEALSQNQRHDISWTLATQTTYPSWYEMMKRHTTVCEFWTLKQSKNHVMMGSIDAWFYKYLGGIKVNPEHPAFKHFVIDPYFPKDLDWARASTNTIRGRVATHWQRVPGGMEMTVDVPFNTAALVQIEYDRNCSIRIGGRTIDNSPDAKYLGYENGAHILEVRSGIYRLEIRNA